MFKLLSLTFLITLITVSVSGQRKATGNPVLKKVAQPNTPMTSTPQNPVTDLAIQIRAIDTFRNAYRVHYTIRNTGNVPVNLNNIVLQGNVYTSTGGFEKAGGGYVLMPPVLNGTGILDPGAEYMNAVTCGLAGLYTTGQYKYVLQLDNNNILNEADENNNQAEMAMAGTVDPLKAMKGVTVKVNPGVKRKPSEPVITDLSFVSGTIIRKPDGKYEVNYTIRNNGNTAIEININGLRLQGWFAIPGQTGELKVHNSYIRILKMGDVIQPGETVINYFQLPASLDYLQHGSQYEYFLKCDSIDDIPESDENNNLFKINFRMGF